MKNIRRKVTVALDVSEPVEIADGVWQTSLTHPSLVGEMTFVHSQAGGREELLKAIDENLVAGILDVVALLGSITNGLGKKTKATQITADLPRPTLIREKDSGERGSGLR